MSIAALTAACEIARAYGQTASVTGPYVSLGAGVGWQQTLKATATPDIGLPYSQNFSSAAGPAGEVGFGFGFGNGLRLDLDVPILSNSLRATGGAFHGGASEIKYGGMLNVMYDFNLGLPVTPYLGVGVGGLEIARDGFSAAGTGFTLPARIGSQVNGDFAYQGIVGLAYPFDFAPGLAMTAEYRVLGLFDPQPSLHASVQNAAGDTVAGGTVRFSGDVTQSLMLGLRYAFAQPPAAPAHAGAAYGAPPEVLSVRTFLVFFDWDRAELSARARQIIAEAADGSRRVVTTRIDVNGYTDLSGSADYNKGLSKRRAENVAAELVRDGVPGGEITVLGLGDASPLIPTARGVREPENRRVEIVMH